MTCPKKIQARGAVSSHKVQLRWDSGAAPSKPWRQTLTKPLQISTPPNGFQKPRSTANIEDVFSPKEALHSDKASTPRNPPSIESLVLC